MRIWTLNDCLISIFPSDANGTEPILTGDSTTPPIVQYCYVESAALDAAVELDRRDRNCMDMRELVNNSSWDSCQCSVSGILLSKSIEINTTEVFNYSKWLVVDFLLSARGEKDDEIHRLSFCKAASFQLTGRDNQNMIYSAVFEATKYT